MNSARRSAPLRRRRRRSRRFWLRWRRLFWSFTRRVVSYRGAIALNLIVFAVAGICAQGVARGRLQTLLKRDARHLKLWLTGFAIWAFVAVQLAWNLRPFVGSPEFPIEFLRADAFSNVYLGLLKILFG